MQSLIFEIFISLMITILGFVVILKIYFTAKGKRGMWKLYRELADELDLELKEGTLRGYGLPDLFGDVNDRKTYVHPSKEKKGKGARPAKTIIAVEHDLDISGDLIISDPETSEIDEELPGLDVHELNELGYVLSTQDHKNRGKVNELFTSEIANKLDDLIVRNGGSFRALIFEPGVAMFSTYGFEMEKGKIVENFKDLVDLIGMMEKDGRSRERDKESERFEIFSKKNSLLGMEIGILMFLLLAAVYLIYDSILDGSYLFGNLGIILLLITSVRFYTIGWIRGWYGQV